MNFVIDNLAMLLSTDWFLQQSNILGLRSDMISRKALQLKCRDIVTKFLNGETDYWQISFSDDRVRETHSGFFEAAVQCKFEKADIELLQTILAQSEVDSTEADSISLLENLTQLLISDPAEDVTKELPHELIERIKPFFFEGDVGRSEIIQTWLNSNSDWDKQLRNKTSDMPELLGDFLISIYRQACHFSHFWTRVVQNTSAEERQQLLAWYRITAFEYIHRDLAFPNWVT